MYFLYPRLPLATANKLISELESLSIQELCDISDLHHPAIQYYESGSRAPENDLKQVQEAIRSCAAQYGYPNLVGDQESRSFDTACGKLLHQNMRLHPSEASHIEMWAFLTCVLLPDVVRWRFPGDATPVERFIGSDRGLRRNTFGRLWWRAYLLYQPSLEEPYKFFDWLYEDDLVQITERNSIAADRTLLAVFVQAFVKAVEQYGEIPRRDLMRETIKRVRRLLSFVAFELLDEQQTRDLVDNMFKQTAGSIKDSRMSNGVLDFQIS